MRYIIFVLVLILMLGLFLLRKKERMKLQRLVGLHEEDAQIIQQPYVKWVMNKAEYTESSLYKLTLFSLLLMIPGSMLGIFFRNMQLGLLLSVVFAALPYIYLLLLERKKQKLILKEVVPFLTSLDWSYESHSFSIADALEQAEEACPFLIRKEYGQMLQKIHAAMKPSIAMKEFAEQTNSNIFKVLSGILATQEQRNDAKAFRNSLKELMRHVVKTNNRIAKVDTTLKKKNFFLLSLLGTSIVIFGMSFTLMKNPLTYFRESGASAMIIGVLALLLPLFIYFMSVVRRRF